MLVKGAPEVSNCNVISHSEGITCGALYSTPHRICSWWCHRMETFSALLALCAVNSPVTGEFPAQRPVTQSFGVFFDLCLILAWVNNREAGDLRCHRAHYDVIVMSWVMLSCNWLSSGTILVNPYPSGLHRSCWSWPTWNGASLKKWYSMPCKITSVIARFMGATRGPSGADRTQVGPMLAPWALLSGEGCITRASQGATKPRAYLHGIFSICV